MQDRLPIYADAHADIFYEAVASGSDIFTGANTIHVTWREMRQVNQRLQVCSLWTPAKFAGRPAEEFCWSILHALDRASVKHPDKVEKVTGSRRLAELAASPDGPVALLPWIEGGSPIRGDLSVFHAFADAGVRGIGLTWNHANEIADGCGVPEPRRGLTEFGVRLLAEMEQRQVIVDCAHLPEPAFWDVVSNATRPFVVTHTGMRHFVPVTRNLSDEMARAVANSGGFVGIDFYPGHIRLGAPESGPGALRHTLSGRRTAATLVAGRSAPSVDDLASHIAHAIKVCGEDHVVLGSDWDGFRDPLSGLERLSAMPNLIPALERAGLTDRQVEKVFGTNLLRILGELLPPE